MELEEFRLELREMEAAMVAGEVMHHTITLEEAEAEQEDIGEYQQKQPCHHIFCIVSVIPVRAITTP